MAMLDTPNIRDFGEIAVRNLRRYCERHGYGLHIYRDLPAEPGQEASGNSLKPWVLYKHLPRHEWLFWVGADVIVIVIDQSKFLEVLIQKRDHVIGQDISWTFNSGIVGYSKYIRRA